MFIRLLIKIRIWMKWIFSNIIRFFEWLNNHLHTFSGLLQINLSTLCIHPPNICMFCVHVHTEYFSPVVLLIGLVQENDEHLLSCLVAMHWNTAYPNSVELRACFALPAHCCHLLITKIVSNLDIMVVAIHRGGNIFFLSYFQLKPLKSFQLV